MAEARRVTRGAGGGLKPGERHRVAVFDSAERLARAAAEAFAEVAARAGQTRGRFLVALAGGTTPRAMYRLLAEDATFRHAVPWPLVHVFWGDERAVGPDHPDSNYRAAHEALLSRVPIPAAQIYRMPADDPDPDRAARAYETTLRRARPERRSLRPGHEPRPRPPAACHAFPPRARNNRFPPSHVCRQEMTA